MSKSSIDHLIVAGAGFSHNAGLPLASDFTRAMLDVANLKKDGPSAILVEFATSFVDHVFGDGATLSADRWPPLEDLFTIVDLAANTGHNLGNKYSASDLRTVRRALIVRLIRMLAIAHRSKRDAPDEQYRTLVQVLKQLDTDTVGLLNMNWDTVVEEIIAKEKKITFFDYGCEAIAARFVNGHVRLADTSRSINNPLKLLKPHGSVNWMYCDSCSRLFWFPSSATEQIAARLFRDSDGETVSRFIGRKPKPAVRRALCPGCGAPALGTRFVTFSYRKALEFPMHQATWARAEELLREAKTWIFIGYSMPSADYQFKYLLKRVQLSRRSGPKLILVTKDPSDATIDNYKKFFGSSSLPDSNILRGGVDDDAVSRLHRLGVISDPV